ncbi:hypothetical protein [Roseibium sp.]|uniref:hypothetical protein n=1 Tax=Roseibium sp. TaxID=1936156 RepID=UPI003BAFF440
MGLAMDAPFRADTVDEKYWQTALDCFNAGKSAEQAAKTVWSQWTPERNVAALATIIGALYADTYWSGVKMRPGKLGGDLSSATGLQRALCTAAARKAFATWSGLYLRPNMSGNGEIPKQGDMTESPDSLAGSVAISPERLIKNWNVMDWGPLGLKSYAYGRAQSTNIGVPISSPTLSMFYADAAINPPPSSWVRLYTSAGNNTKSFLVDVNSKPTISPTFRCANIDAFEFAPDGRGPYSLIALASTEFFKNDPFEIRSNWSQAQWLSNNGAAGWRTISLQPAGGTQQFLFYNFDNSWEVFEFKLCAENLPFGSKVRLDAIGLSSVSVATIRQPTQHVSLRVKVPPDYLGALVVGFPELLEGAKLTIRLHWTLPSGHALRRKAVKIAALDSHGNLQLMLGALDL